MPNVLIHGLSGPDAERMRLVIFRRLGELGEKVENLVVTEVPSNVSDQVCASQPFLELRTTPDMDKNDTSQIIAVLRTLSYVEHIEIKSFPPRW